MRKLLFSIPIIYKAYLIARALFALIGVCFVVWLVNATKIREMTGLEISINYVWLCVNGVLFALAIKMSIKNRLASRGQLQPFEIDGKGDVSYNDITPEQVRKTIDFSNLTEGRISSLLSTYNSNKYRGKAWNKFRTDLLSARKPYKAGQTINF